MLTTFCFNVLICKKQCTSQIQQIFSLQKCIYVVLYRENGKKEYMKNETVISLQCKNITFAKLTYLDHVSPVQLHFQSKFLVYYQATCTVVLLLHLYMQLKNDFS